MLSLQNVLGEARTGGRSRFSKALPSIPIISDNDLPLPPLPKDLPELELPALSGPLPLPAQFQSNDDTKKTNCISRKPVGSSAPKPNNTPHPDLTNVNSSPPINPSNQSMTVSRQPISGSVLQVPPQPILIVPPEPSPTDSLSSLLSAYSREPDAPMSESTYTTVSTSNISSSASENLPLTARRGASVGGSCIPRTQSLAARSAGHQLGSKDGSRPAPHPKTEQRDKPKTQPKPLPSAPAAEQTSSSRPEIWKRRPQTAETNKELPDLKLNYSYGWTTSASSIQTAVISASSGTGTVSKTAAEEPKQASPPKLPVSGLPGGDIRPAAKDQSQADDKTIPMGGAASKVSHLKEKLNSKKKGSRVPAVGSFPVRTDSRRPPTPEYRQGDIGPPPSLVDNVAKPASPISVSASPKEDLKVADASSDLSQKPQKPTNEPAASANPLRIVPSPRQRPPATAPNLRLATSLQDLRRGGPSPHAQDAYSAMRRPALSSKERNSASPESASKGSSTSGTNGLGIVAGSPRPPGTASDSSDSRIVYSDTQGPMYRGRDGTLYAEMKVNDNPNPEAAYFPTQTDKPVEAGTIIASKPLSQSHFNCFQNHRTMNRLSNRNYPLTCQTCARADTEDRWVCTFCHLRICEACLKALNGHQKDLQSLVDQLGTNTPLNLSSTSRPGSVFGLDILF